MHIVINGFEMDLCKNLIFFRIGSWQLCWTPHEGLLVDRLV